MHYMDCKLGSAGDTTDERHCSCPSAADCAPGLARNEAGACEACPIGKFCIGGDAKVNPTNAADNCPPGLQTTFAGAKSMAQVRHLNTFGQPHSHQVSLSDTVPKPAKQSLP